MTTSMSSGRPGLTFTTSKQFVSRHRENGKDALRRSVKRSERQSANSEICLELLDYEENKRKQYDEDMQIYADMFEAYLDLEEREYYDRWKEDRELDLFDAFEEDYEYELEREKERRAELDRHYEGLEDADDLFYYDEL